MSGNAFGRRDLLRAAGLTLLVPAFLRDAFAVPENAGARLVIFMQPNGTHQRAFWPDPTTGRSPILDPLLTDAALARKLLLIRGVVNTTVGFGNEHDRGFNSLWTGVLPSGTPDDAFGGGPSIDQVLRAALKPAVLFPTLNAGVLAADVAPKNGHRRSFSYVDSMQQIPTQTDPYRLYAALFRQVESDPQRATQELALRRSALDASARDLTTLSARLGPAQRRKLDAHTTALREYEARLSQSLEASGACSKPAAIAPGIDLVLEDNVPQLTQLMLDLVVVSLSCNLTRLVTFPFGMCGNQWFYRWLNIARDNHSDIAHLDTEEGLDPVITGYMVQISRFWSEQVARFCSALDAIPEETGSVLDNSLVIWANENGNGSHSLSNLPIACIGRAAGRQTLTGVLDRGTQTHHQLNTSVLRWMGVHADGYGDQPNSGGLTGT